MGEAVSKLERWVDWVAMCGEDWICMMKMIPFPTAQQHVNHIQVSEPNASPDFRCK